MRHLRYLALSVLLTGKGGTWLWSARHLLPLRNVDPASAVRCPSVERRRREGRILWPATRSADPETISRGIEHAA
ncbi:hypothetical protein B0H19DRAFT_1151371 [Mycena capillaripes]|nr:hypothetical protein B0H19DRAFT_1151371 [Mycena capillaripes]